MAEPSRPINPRVVYRDSTTVPIRSLSYESTINGTHYWVALDPQFVRWAPGVHTAYDVGDGQARHEIIIGFDYRGAPPSVKEVTMEPTNLTTEQLCDVLRNMANHVSCGDSYEGNLAYTFSETDTSCFAVQGVYRIGNRFGQGSVRLIGDVRDPSIETIVLCGSDGTPTKSVTLTRVRPRIDVITWDGRLFVWNTEHQEYREGTYYDVAGH